MLTDSSYISNTVMRINCPINARNCTANIPMNRTRSKIHEDKSSDSHNSFFADPNISRIVLAEHVLEKCDSLDLEIMKSLINKEKYIDIADKLHVSENTVKYRIKLLLNFCKARKPKQAHRAYERVSNVKKSFLSFFMTFLNIF